LCDEISVQSLALGPLRALSCGLQLVVLHELGAREGRDRADARAGDGSHGGDDGDFHAGT
jgi:hypothetical protein